MNIDTLQKQIDNMDYWDCKILDFQTNFFGDEVKIVIEGDEEADFVIKFLLCYKVDYETDARDRWHGLSVKYLNKLQLGYFAHEISLKESVIAGFIEAKVIIPFIFAKIICKDISIERIKHNDADYFWSNNN
jgi:hypothetical protein